MNEEVANAIKGRSARPALGLLALGAAFAAVLCALAASGASAAVGVEAVSRHAGQPGDEVALTLACGFCFPPCEGPKGQRHPAGFERGPCMLGTKEGPPDSFGISLVPRSRAPEPGECGDATCSQSVLGPPRNRPYAFLGLAIPPAGGNNPESGDPPRYLLRFTIPNLRRGAYAYVIWCDVCIEGRRGSLISSPRSRNWRLAVKPPTAAG